MFLREQIGLNHIQRRAIWGLVDQFHHSEGEKRLCGVIKSNAYLSTDEGGLGLYPTIARFNHSCSPNLAYGFDGWTMRVYSVRDIEDKEELTTSYSDMVCFHVRDIRQYFLRAKFNFECVCRGCQEHSPQSDANRTRLRFLAELLSNRDAQVKRGDLHLLLETIQLIKKESLEASLTATTYKLGHSMALSLGDEVTAEIMGLECLALLKLSKGGHHLETLEFAHLLNEVD